MSEQLFVFLWTVFSGALVGLVFDVFRVTRRVKKTGKILTGAEDIIFFIIAALVLFVTVYAANSGELRFFEFAGAGVGALLYFLLLSRAVMAVGAAALTFLVKCVLFIIKILLFPAAFIFKLLKKPFGMCFWYARRKATGMGRMIKTQKDRLKLRRKSARLAAKKR